MSHVHDQIWHHFEHMVTQLDTPLPHVDPPFTNKHTFCAQCFHNYTCHHARLKLTPLGHVILKCMYECWSIDLPDDWSWSAHMIIHIHKRMKYPYYWDRKRFYVYHSEIGLEFELVNRDWRAWIRWD